MRLLSIVLGLIAGLWITANGTTADAEMFITEWMYSGSEFAEFTNMGAVGVDMTGWSFDDDSRTAGTTDLSGFGVVAPGESVILCEDPAADFRTLWGLDSSVKIVGDNIANLGKSDEINLFNAADDLIDRLTYTNDGENPITKDISGNPTTTAALGANDASQWVLSAVGDRFGSYTAGATPFIANPGRYVDAVPEPSTIVLLLAATALCAIRFRRNR